MCAGITDWRCDIDWFRRQLSHITTTTNLWLTIDNYCVQLMLKKLIARLLRFCTSAAKSIHLFIQSFSSFLKTWLHFRVAKILWTLCYATPEEILELQRPHRATGNRRNLQCGDDSIMRANATRDTGSPCLGAVGASVWGVGLAGRRFLCAGKYLALLIEHERSGPQHPAQGALRFRGSCSWLGKRNGSWMVGYLCSCTGCAVTRHLGQ